MIDKLIEQAKYIEDRSDANIQGSLIQVTSNLKIDECETIFKEWCGDNAKKGKSYAKKIIRVRDDPKHFSIRGLRDDVSAILRTALREQG